MSEPPAKGLRALRLFEEALDVPSDQRSAWLDEHCVNTEERSRVERLLKQDSTASLAFNPPSAEQLGALIESGGQSTRRIGSYQLESVISSGGMGIVWKASQNHPARTVALKLIRQGFSSEQAMRRFRFEAEVLGRLNHSGVARIYEAGVHEEGEPGFLIETPWFAMELVEGARSITEHSDAEGLNTIARIELFLQACAALQHAHQRGVIHRDIKPHNILINDRGEVKLIDFGASFTGQDLTSPLTQEGQLLGTLRYMSPEQLEGAREDLSTASDVYSLGIVLYELVCGALPFNTDAPSSSNAVLQALTRGAHILPRKANPDLSPEVEAVILKCLEVQPHDRYGSPRELAEDLQRHLAHEPVLARRANLWYRCKLYSRRHAGMLVATVSILAVALTGTVNSLRLAENAQRSELSARRAERRSHLRAAGSSLNSGDLNTARNALDQIPEQNRGFLWWCFDYQADASSRTLHTLAIPRVPMAFAPDGKSFVVATAPDMIQAYDTQAGNLLWKQGGRGNSRAGFNVGNPKVYRSSLDDNGVPWNKPSRVWNISNLSFDETGECLIVTSRKIAAVLDATKGGIKSSPPLITADPLASTQVNKDSNVQVFHRLRTGVLCYRIDGGTAKQPRMIELGKATEFALHPSGDSVVFGDLDGHLVVAHDLSSLEPKLRVLNEGQATPITCITFDGPSELLAVGREGGTVELWKGNALRWRTGVHFDAVTSLAFTPDSTGLASGSRSGAIATQGADLGHFKGHYLGHTGGISALAFQRDTMELVSASSDQTIRHWTLGQLGVQETRIQGRYIDSIRAGSNGTIYALTRKVSGGPIPQLAVKLEILNPQSLSASRHIALGTSRTQDLKISEEHGRAYVLTKPGFLMSFDLEAEPNRLRLSAGQGAVRFDDFAITADQTRLIAAQNQGGLAEFSLPDNTFVGAWGDFKGRACALATSPKGNLIAVGAYSGLVDILDASTGKVLNSVELGSTKVASLAFDPEGERLAISFQGGRPALFMWSIKQRKLVAELEGHKSAITGFSFHPSEDLIISKSTDNRIILWDLNDSAELYSWDAKPWAHEPIWPNGGNELAWTTGLGILQVLQTRPMEDRRKVSGFFKGVDSIDQVSGDQLALHSWKLGLDRTKPKASHLEALHLATRATKLDPTAPMAALALALAHYRLGQYEDGLHAMDVILQLEEDGAWPKGDRPTHLLRALLLYASGNRSEAMELYEVVAAIRYTPTGLDYLNGQRNPLKEEAAAILEGDDPYTPQERNSRAGKRGKKVKGANSANWRQPKQGDR